MPAATDVRNSLADTLWTLLEAQATVTAALAPNRRIRGNTGWLRELMSSGNAPADAPRLKITFGRGRHPLYTGRTGFSVEDDTFTTSHADDFEVRRVFEAIIEYREKLPTDPGAHPIQEAIEHTLFLAGPVLGAPTLVDELGELTSDERETRENEAPNPGRITTWRLPITCKQSALALIALTA